MGEQNTFVVLIWKSKHLSTRRNKWCSVETFNNRCQTNEEKQEREEFDSPLRHAPKEKIQRKYKGIKENVGLPRKRCQLSGSQEIDSKLVNDQVKVPNVLKIESEHSKHLRN